MLTSAGPVTLVNVATTNVEIPVKNISLADGRQIIVFASQISGDPDDGVLGVFARFTDADGTPAGAALNINLPFYPGTTFIDVDLVDTLQLASLPNGRIAAIYTSFEASPTGTPVAKSYIDEYNANGTFYSSYQFGPTGTLVQDMIPSPDVLNILTTSFGQSGTPQIYTFFDFTSTEFSFYSYNTPISAVTGEFTFNSANWLVFEVVSSSLGPRIDFEFGNPAQTLTQSTAPVNGVVFSDIEEMLPGRGTSVLAVVSQTITVNPTTPQGVAVSSYSLRIWGATDNTVPVLLASLAGPQNVPTLGEGDMIFSDAVVLVDGSIVVGYTEVSSAGISSAKIARINAQGVMSQVDLGFVSGLDAGPKLSVLADQSILVSFAATENVPTSANQIEAYSQRFFTGAVPISTTPTNGADSLTGTNGNDALNGLGGNDTISAFFGNDVVDGGSGADSMSGGLGDDVYYADDVGDQIIEFNGEGNDLAYISAYQGALVFIETVVAFGSGLIDALGDSFANTFNAATGIRFAGVTFNALGGDDVLYGSNYADRLDGDSGNDILVGYSSVGGADTLVGGSGSDVYFVFENDDVLTELAGGGLDTVYSYANIALSANIEQVVLVGAGTIASGNGDNNNLFGNNLTSALTLDGAGGNDWIIGGTGNDTLIGGAGNDQLQGLAGTNTMQGGANDDQYFSTSSADIITENLNEGFDTLYASYNVAALAANVEQLSVSGGATLANGNGLANVIYANNNSVGTNINADAGADIIYGSGFADTILGGLGNDTMQGAGGADRFTYAAGNMGADRITDFADGSDLMVLSGLGYTSGSIGSAITISGGANALVTFVSGALTGTTITLLGVNQANIAAADFVF
jgi:Ca2+-binding RTX toxin-like protein